MSYEKHKTIAFLGDSITWGLGVRGHSYVDLLQERFGQFCQEHHRLPVKMENVSCSAGIVSVMRQFIPQLADLNPSVVVVMLGSVDAIPRPDGWGHWLISHLPEPYNKPWNLEPRPFFSPNPFKAFMQKFESGMRSDFRLLLMKLFGAKPFKDRFTFKQHYRQLVEDLSQLPSQPQIVLCSCLHISPYEFPGADENFENYNKIMHHIAEEFHAHYVDLREAFESHPTPLQLYFEDGFHPNHEGHREISEGLFGKLRDILGYQPRTDEIRPYQQQVQPQQQQQNQRLARQS